MSKYIDADKLKQELDEWAINLHKPTNLVRDDTFVIIDEQPPADAVEVVRCKDCKHHEELLNNNDENVLCWVHDIDVIVDRNGYCNYGEREEQEHEHE